jgi:hypothetical protein
MSEGTPIGRTDDPYAVETPGATSTGADREAAFGEAPEDGPDADVDAADLRSSIDADRAAGYGRSAEDQEDLDAGDADDIAVRLTED